MKKIFYILLFCSFLSACGNQTKVVEIQKPSEQPEKAGLIDSFTCTKKSLAQISGETLAKFKISDETSKFNSLFVSAVPHKYGGIYMDSKNDLIHALVVNLDVETMDQLCMRYSYSDHLVFESVKYTLSEIYKVSDGLPKKFPKDFQFSSIGPDLKENRVRIGIPELTEQKKKKISNLVDDPDILLFVEESPSTFQ